MPLEEHLLSSTGWRFSGPMALSGHKALNIQTTSETEKAIRDKSCTLMVRTWIRNI